MKNPSLERGLATAATVIIVAAVVIGAGVAYYFATRAPATQKAMEDANMAKNDMMVKTEEDTMVKKDEAMMKDEVTGMMQHSGVMLAGKLSPLLDFTKADFEAAKASDKLVVLYFYANWCPNCAVEFPVMQSAFNELTTDQAIGFRVNYNDSDTDPDEVALAREHGIGYQHTKVFLRNGQQILKSPETWDKQRYLTEINGAT
ncbi:MAG: thioredoxin family protein [Patescibacteria group bacterium]